MKLQHTGWILAMACVLTMTACAGPSAVRKYTVEVVKEYPHDTLSYTQGLFFHNGRLQESAGGYGQSSFRKDIDLATGRCTRRMDFDAKYFAEGSAELGGELFILTWLEHVAFVYDADSLVFKRAHRFPRQGWGLTTDGKQLIASDGSHQLHFLDRQFKRLRSIEVTLEGKKLPQLNELEWIDGRIWANIYQSDRIAIIHPSSGAVEGIIDCKGLLPKHLRTKDTDVLNGIATDGKSIFLTGKNWPRLYEVKLVEKR